MASDLLNEFYEKNLCISYIYRSTQGVFKWALKQVRRASGQNLIPTAFTVARSFFRGATSTMSAGIAEAKQVEELTESTVFRPRWSKNDIVHQLSSVAHPHVIFVQVLLLFLVIAIPLFQ
jgi:hypothetical protein